MSSVGAALRAAVPVSSARAAASRKNGAKSRGPKTPEGKARAAQNALRHGMRAQKYVILPQEDAAEFAALETAILAELAPVGVLQTVLAKRVAVAAWRLARADRMEAEALEFRSYEGANARVALMRDGNGTRSFETLMRYRNATMAEFMRALKTLKALQAEQAAATGPALAAHPKRSAARPPLAQRPQPNRPERAAERPLPYALPEPPTSRRALHESAAPWLPNEPDGECTPIDPELYRLAASAPPPRGLVPIEPDYDRTPNEPERRRVRVPDQRETERPPRTEPSGMRATESHGRMDRLNEYPTNG